MKLQLRTENQLRTTIVVICSRFEQCSFKNSLKKCLNQNSESVLLFH